MKSKILRPDEKTRLLEVARKVAKNAYAPYSKFRVGAAILTESGDMFSGCNVENVSYGLTICAERVAIFSALAQKGLENMKIKAIAIVNEHGTECSPCGACRQVILEFGKDAIIFFQGVNGIKEVQISDLLPNAFISYD